MNTTVTANGFQEPVYDHDNYIITLPVVLPFSKEEYEQAILHARQGVPESCHYTANLVAVTEGTTLYTILAEGIELP